MSGFGGFGTGSTGGGFFGAKPPEQSAGGFTMPATTTTTTVSTTASGLTFMTPTFGTAGTGGLFGSQQQAPAFGTGLGAKTGIAPATGTGTTGFTFNTLTPNTNIPAFGTSTPNTNVPTFGTPTPNTNVPTFGTPTPNTNVPTFGTPTPNTNVPAFGTSTPNTNVPAFGSSTPSTSAPTFGTPASTSLPTFGVKTTLPSLPTFGSFGTTTAPAFGTVGYGAQKTPATTGFTLPTTTTTSTTTAAPTFNFGLTSAATTSAPLTFGAATTSTATTSAPSLTFGVSVPSTTPATTQSTGFNLSAPSTTASLTFGAPKTTGGLTFGTGTTAFGNLATTATPTFNLGTSVTTAPTLGTGLFGTPKTTETTSVPTSTTVTTVGLGGLGNTQTTQGLSGTGTLEPKHAKDHALPDPILQTLNDFQNFTKQQKSISVEISHGSSKPLKKVQEDTEAMESLLTMITSGLTRNAIAVDKLKTETAQGLHQAEMAQRNHETPPGLEYDSSSPAEYFNDLVTKFETDTVRLRVQIEASEKHLRSLTQSSTISPQELTLAMRRLHETLIVLAARVQALHTAVQSQKEQYKNLRRVFFKDDPNIFDNEIDQNINKKQTIYSLRSLTGPTPFSETPGAGPSLHVDGLAMLASSAGASIPTTSSNPSWMSPLQRTANTSSILPASNLLGSFQPLEIPGFQLSKPPTGNKRSRR